MRRPGGRIVRDWRQWTTATLGMVLLVLAVLGLHCDRAHGQVVAVRVGQQECTQSGCRQMIAYGTAFNVGRVEGGWCFVSVGHTFGPGRKAIDSGGFKIRYVQVGLEDGWLNTPKFYWDERRDVGAIVVPELKHGHTVLTLGDDAAAGDECEGRGFAGGTRWRVAPHTAASKEWFSGQSIGGESGGPMMSDGRVVGLIRGTTPEETHCVPVSEVKAALRKWFKELPTVPENQQTRIQPTPDPFVSHPVERRPYVADCRNCGQRFAEINRTLNAILIRVSTLETTEPTDTTELEVQIAELKQKLAEAQERLDEPITFVFPSGQVLPKRLGETLKLHLIPKE